MDTKTHLNIYAYIKARGHYSWKNKSISGLGTRAASVITSSVQGNWLKQGTGMNNYAGE